VLCIMAPFQMRGVIGHGCGGSRATVPRSRTKRRDRAAVSINDRKIGRSTHSSQTFVAHNSKNNLAREPGWGTERRVAASLTMDNPANCSLNPWPEHVLMPEQPWRLPSAQRSRAVHPRHGERLDPVLGEMKPPSPGLFVLVQHRSSPTHLAQHFTTIGTQCPSCQPRMMTGKRVK